MAVNTGFDTGKRVPSVCSPVWEGITLPLFNYLSSPRSIDAIIEWAAIRGHTHEGVNNMLAWLSFTGKARHDDLLHSWMRGANHESVLEVWRGHQPVGMEG